jgi:hypothetical protein
MALREGGRLEVRLLLGPDVIGGRRRIGQHHVGFALLEESVGLRPSLGDGDDPGLQLRPCLTGAVAVDLAHPQEEAESRSAGARVLEHDRRSVGVLDEFLQARRRALEAVAVVHEGEMAPVEGDEDVVRPFDRKREILGRHAVFGEQPEGLRFGGEVHVEADHDVGLGGLALEAQAPHEAAGILGGHEGELASANRLEAFLDGLAGSVFPDEGPVGVDREDGLRLCDREAAQAERQRDREGNLLQFMHGSAPGRGRAGRGGESQRAMAGLRACSIPTPA